MLEKYKDNQEIITKLLIESLENEKLVQAYLFCCDDIEFIYNYAKDFAKEIIKQSNIDEESLENIYKRIDNEEYTELKVIMPDGNYIKKEQLIELQNSVKNKPVEANKIIYIIKNCDRLNSSSANSILKFLEEPADDIIAILLTDNLNMVIPTIKSRCQVLNFKNVRNFYKGNEKIKKYLNVTDEETLENIDNLILSTLKFAQEIEKKKKNVLIYEKTLLVDVYKITGDILLFLNVLIYLYTDVLNSKLGRNLNYMYDYEDIVDDISKLNNENSIIKKINIIEEVKKELLMNVNSKLLFDKLIIELSEV